MTTITDKVTKPLEVLQAFQDPADLGDLLTAIRNDLLGISQQKIPIKKLAKKFGLEDPSYLQEAVEALAYLILHICKINASEEEFFLIYQ